MRNAALVGVATVCLLSTWFLAARPAAAQPILERLEERIRNRLAQPADDAAQQADQPALQAGYLGVLADDRQDRGRGVRVLAVRPGSPAEKAGLRKGDLITSAAGAPVGRMADLADTLVLFPPGETLRLEVFRDAQRRQVQVTLGRRAARPPEPPPEAVPTPPPEPLSAPVAVPAPPSDDVPAAGPRFPAPLAGDRPAHGPPTMEQLLRRIEQLERRVAELERALTEARKKP